MFNVFYPDHRILDRYDIKGCFVGRYTKPSPQGSQAVLILKEKNLSEKKLRLGNDNLFLYLLNMGLTKIFCWVTVS